MAELFMPKVLHEITNICDPLSAEQFGMLILRLIHYEECGHSDESNDKFVDWIYDIIIQKYERVKNTPKGKKAVK